MEESENFKGKCSDGKQLFPALHPQLSAMPTTWSLLILSGSDAHNPNSRLALCVEETPCWHLLLDDMGWISRESAFVERRLIICFRGVGAGQLPMFQ